MATPRSVIKAINEPYRLTSGDVQAFRENGYIHLEGVLSDAVQAITSLLSRRSPKSMIRQQV